ncbi:DUF6049 family protein [Salinibacterium sp. ZJ77]|uniref:DUF6049 family protein n=1 Tax=Salinibacterium sp. ZJ77 TaxID=2708337 RepID=UPI0014225B1B|nr:DUF6049 family protein [Salinibacterium sp. ZJ77]
MPLTTPRLLRALASVLVATGLVAGSASIAAAEPVPDDLQIQPASVDLITPGAGPVSVAVVVPITAPPTVTGLISSEDLAEYTDTFGVLTRQIDTVAATNAALAIDPMILASIRVLGSTAPESARAWLQRLESLPNESFLLAYGDADVVTAARTDTLASLQPRGFGFALDPSRFSDEPVETPAPTATPDTDTDTPDTPDTPDTDAAPPFPTTEQLLAWTSTLPSIAWPATDGVGAADVAALAAAGYESVLLSDADTGEAGSAHVTVEGADALVIDSARSAALRSAAASVLETDRASQLEAFTADLAAQAQIAPGRTMVLAVARTWPGVPSGLGTALAAVEASGAAQVVPLSEVLATPAVPVSLGEGVRDTDREGVFVQLLEDMNAEKVFSSVVVEPELLLEPRTLAHIALYGGVWIGDPEWGPAVGAFETRSEEIVTSVRIERGSDRVLLARSTGLRISVSNALDLAVVVRVSADPRSPILRAEGPVDLTVEPNATASAYIPVEAIANGKVRVVTALHSVSGIPIDSDFANITVRAEWEGVGTLVFVLVLVGIFAAGIIRLILRRRKARALAADSEGSGD